MVAVPILAKAGDVIGVVVLHTEAPREFDDDVLNFLVHTASLVGGAIENAQLYEEARTAGAGADHAHPAEPGARRGHPARGPLRRRHARRPRAAPRRRLPDLPPRRRGGRAGAGRLRSRGRAGAEPAAGRHRPRARPDAAGGRRRPARAAQGRTALWPDVDENALLVAPLVARDEQLGMLCCLANGRQFTDEDAELLGAVANQTAVGLKKAELIERLTAENIVKDMFDALAAGSVEAAEAKAGEARCDLAGPHLFLHVERAPRAGEDAPAWPELAARLETRLRRLYPRAFFDSRHDRVRALAPLPTGRGGGASRDCATACEQLGQRGGARGRNQRRRSRRGERPATDARGRRRGADRPLAGRRGRRDLLRAARRVPLPRPPGSRRGAARPLPAVRRAARRVRPPPRRAAGRDAGALPRRPRQRHGERPSAVRASEHRPPATRADRASRGPGPPERGSALAGAGAEAREAAPRRGRESA